MDLIERNIKMWVASFRVHSIIKMPLVAKSKFRYFQLQNATHASSLEFFFHSSGGGLHNPRTKLHKHIIFMYLITHIASDANVDHVFSFPTVADIKTEDLGTSPLTLNA